MFLYNLIWSIGSGNSLTQKHNLKKSGLEPIYAVIYKNESAEICGFKQYDFVLQLHLQNFLTPATLC